MEYAVFVPPLMDALILIHIAYIMLNKDGFVTFVDKILIVRNQKLVFQMEVVEKYVVRILNVLRQLPIIIYLLLQVYIVKKGTENSNCTSPAVCLSNGTCGSCN